MKKWFIYISLCLLNISQLSSQEVSAYLSNNYIRIGEQTTIELKVEFSAAEKNIEMPVLKDTISKFIEIVDISPIDTSFDEEDITKKIFTQNIVITSWDSGYYAIPPFE